MTCFHINVEKCISYEKETIIVTSDLRHAKESFALSNVVWRLDIFDYTFAPLPTVKPDSGSTGVQLYYVRGEVNNPHYNHQ